MNSVISNRLDLTGSTERRHQFGKDNILLSAPPRQFGTGLNGSHRGNMRRRCLVGVARAAGIFKEDQ